MPLEVLHRLLLLLLAAPGALPTLLFLAVVAYYDLRRRDVDPRLLLAPAPTVALLYAALGLWPVTPRALCVSLLVTGLLTAATLLLARRGVVGGGDPWLVLAVGLLNPTAMRLWGLPTTPLALSLALGSAYALAEALANAVHNARRIGEFAALTRGMGLARRLYYFVAGRVMTVEEFRGSRFLFPLVTEGSARLVPRVGWEPLEGAEHRVGGRALIAAPGLPLAALLLVGYALHLALLAAAPWEPL